MARVVRLSALVWVLIAICAIASIIVLILASVNLHFVDSVEDDAATEDDLDKLEDILSKRTLEILDIINALPNNIVSQQQMINTTSLLTEDGKNST